MKKYWLFLIIGVLFVFGGVFLYSRNSDNPIGSVNEKTLSRNDAIGIVNGLVQNAIKVYENPKSVFIVENSSEDDDFYTVNVDNYNSVLKSIFTDNGIKQLEKTEFDGKSFSTKEENVVYLLKDIPVNSSYIKSSINYDQVAIYEKKINCVVTFSSYEIDSQDVLNYYVITKNITVVKNEDSWLIENFDYVNN